MKATTVPDIASMSRHGISAVNVPDRASAEADIVGRVSRRIFGHEFISVVLRVTSSLSFKKMEANVPSASCALAGSKISEKKRESENEGLLHLSHPFSFPDSQ